MGKLLCSEGPPLFTLEIKDVVKMRRDDRVADAVREMVDRRIGSVVIVDDEGRPEGIFTERDLLIKVIGEGRSLDTRLGEVMTPNPIVGKEDWSASRALETMISRGFRHLPIVDDNGVLVGIVSIKDIARVFFEEVDVEELYSAG